MTQLLIFGQKTFLPASSFSRSFGNLGVVAETFAARRTASTALYRKPKQSLVSMLNRLNQSTG